MTLIAQPLNRRQVNASRYIICIHNLRRKTVRSLTYVLSLKYNDCVHACDIYIVSNLMDDFCNYNRSF